VTRILIPADYTGCQYGIIDQEKTALYVMGIINADHHGDLIVALPWRPDGTKSGICSVPSGYRFRIRRIPLKSRHRLLRGAPDHWDPKDCTPFPEGLENAFDPKELLKELTPELMKNAPSASAFTERQLKRNLRVIESKPIEGVLRTTSSNQLSSAKTFSPWTPCTETEPYDTI